MKENCLETPNTGNRTYLKKTSGGILVFMLNTFGNCTSPLDHHGINFVPEKFNEYIWQRKNIWWDFETMKYFSQTWHVWEKYLHWYLPLNFCRGVNLIVLKFFLLNVPSYQRNDFYNCWFQQGQFRASIFNLELKIETFWWSWKLQFVFTFAIFRV